MLESSPPPKKYREFLVQPKAAKREAMALIGVICLIVLLMAIRFSLIESTDSKESRQSYQLSNLSLKSQAPTIYRALLGSIEDILDLRLDTGEWPETKTLIDEALPPFANVFLPIGLRGFTWELHKGDGWVDYFGVNAGAALEKKEGGDPLENCFILRIIDLQSKEHPHPHLGKDNNSNMRFSSQIWINTKITDYPGATLIERGWKWIVPENGVGDGTESVLFEQPE